MITKIDNIGVAVAGLTRRLPFWSEALGLAGEGVAAPLALWVLNREVRSLTGMARACAAGASVDRVIADFHVWSNRKAMVRKALTRHHPDKWLRILAHAARADRALKRGGAPAWDIVEQVAMLIAGVKISPPDYV